MHTLSYPPKAVIIIGDFQQKVMGLDFQIP